MTTEGLLSCAVPQLPPLGNEAHAWCRTYRATMRTEWGDIHTGLRTAPAGTRAPAGVAPATPSSSPSPEAQHREKPTAQGGRGAKPPTWGCTSSSQTPAMSARASGATVMSLGFAAVSWASVPTPDGTARGLPGLTHVDVCRTWTGPLQKQKSKPWAQVLQEGGLGDGGHTQGPCARGSQSSREGAGGGSSHSEKGRGRQAGCAGLGSEVWIGI